MSTKKIKILHVVPTYVPAYRYGGTIHAVHGLCKALVQSGHQVTVYTTNVDGNAELDVKIGQAVDVDGVTVYYFPVANLQTQVMRRLYYSPQMKQALSESMAQFDIVHTHSVFLWPTWAAARFAQRQAVPYLMSPHGMLSVDLINKKNTFLKRAWLALFEKNNLKAADSVIATSKFEQKALIDFADENKIKLLANGLDTAQLKQRTERLVSERYILYLGRINWKKGLDRLMDAMQYLPDVKLVVAGNDEENYWSSLQTQMPEVNWQQIDYIGLVGNADKNSLLHYADCLVLPSYNENFGLVVIEALANQCSVVVTDTVGAADVVIEAEAGIVIEGNVDNAIISKRLAEAIQMLVADDVTRMRFANNGYQWVIKHYDWSMIAQSMLQHYQCIIKH